MSQPQPNKSARKKADSATAPSSAAGATVPKKTGATRSRTGCWTCRARRKKCDEKRPACTPCVSKGLACAGYGARLKWGNGVASRGYLTGKSVPVFEARGGSDGAAAVMEQAGPGRVAGTVAGGQQGKGKMKDREGDTRKGGGIKATKESSLGGREIVLDFGVPPTAPTAAKAPTTQAPARKASDAAKTVTSSDGTSTKSITSPEVDSSPPRPPGPETVTLPGGLKLSAFDQTLFDEFKEWGAFYLWVSADPTKPPFYDVLSLCAHSKSLLANCLTFQLSLHPEHESKFESYYAESLRLFREDVCEPGNAVKDATLVSGILLCSIGMTRCMTWTIHLNGMYSILQYRGAIANPTALTTDIVDTIGFLDLPTHILGRQSKTLNIWHDFCRGKAGVEPVSGLPYGLLDLFSTIAQPDIEFQFWTWTGAGIEAKPVQRRAWDAIRFAGIISAREQHRNQLPIQPSPSSPGCPPTVTLVQAIVDCLNDFLATPREEACAVLNLYLYPVFMAGTQYDILSSAQKACIERLWKEFLLDPEGEGVDGGGGDAEGWAVGGGGQAGGDAGSESVGSPYVEAPLDILHELWTNSKGRTADQIAREWSLEVGLF